MGSKCVRQSKDNEIKNNKKMSNQNLLLGNKIIYHKRLLSRMEKMDNTQIEKFMLDQVFMYLKIYIQQDDSPKFQKKIQETVKLIEDEIIQLKQITSALIETIDIVKKIKDFTFQKTNQQRFQQNQSNNKITNKQQNFQEIQNGKKVSECQKNTFQIFQKNLQEILTQLSFKPDYIIDLWIDQGHLNQQQQCELHKKTQRMFIQGENGIYFDQNQKLQCQICLVEIQLSFRAPLQGCKHIFHIDCIQEHIKSHIDANRIQIKCPTEECKNYFTVNDLQKYLDNDLMENYYRFSLNKYVQSKDDRTSWCPTAGCTAVFQYEGQLQDYRCPVCRKHYCLTCKTQYHYRLTCRENQRLKTMNQDYDFIRFVRGSKFKQCPNCKFWVQKSSGCVSIICRCGISFCYNCGGTRCPHGSCQLDFRNH